MQLPKKKCKIHTKLTNQHPASFKETTTTQKQNKDLPEHTYLAAQQGQFHAHTNELLVPKLLL